ncbi:MAG TPA: CRTAC1 family protein [Thermoanaerobaculia bacterium]|nr:CRTAC1 family protein [Thermoanaerobaculia bacterium]
MALLLAGPGLPAGAEIRFRDAVEAWGAHFRHHHGGSGQKYMVETMVGGVVVFDYDGDGDYDLFFVDGGVLPGYEGEAARSVLLRNDGPGRFVDVTAAAGIVVDGYGSGAVAGDADGDGDIDLYVTAFGPNRYFENRGDGTFVEATAAAGLEEEMWSAGATFADFDRDGHLDLYVVNYADFALDNHKFCGKKEEGIRGYCHPDVYNGLPDTYFRNRGDGTFEDATVAAGIVDLDGTGLGVVASDLDDDGWLDLYVANDLRPNYLWRNQGDGTFEDLSLLSGAAYSDRGSPEAGMGIDLADVDGNGLFDIFVTNFELETNALYLNQGNGLFRDGRFVTGLADPSLLMLGFGTAFADFDHDGDEDLVVANGHVVDNQEELGVGGSFRQPNQVFEQVARARFRELSGHGMDAVLASRGLAVGDLDLDGDLDVVVVNSNDVAEAWENTGGSEAGGWLQVDLAAPAGNRHGVGARVELVAGRSQLREVRTGASYLSQNALTLHFGTADASRVERLHVRWPDGRRSELRDLPVRRRVRLQAPR